MILGKKYNRLTVIKEVKDYKLLCRCDCGVIKKIKKSNVLLGLTKSCGCLKSESTTKRNTKHGLRYTPEYRIWFSMHERCYNEKEKCYKYYGGKGVRVCRRWHKRNPKGFENFYKDMGKRPKNKSIDRIDSDGNYSHFNCRWATKKEQAQNSKQTRWFTYKGKTLCLSDWAKELKVSRAIVQRYLKQGESINWIVNHFKFRR